MRGRAIGVVVGAGLAALSAMLPGPPAPAATPPTECVTSAVAGGSGNAITVPLLPCGLATNILILTVTASNTGATTLQMAGFPALPVLQSTGAALASDMLTAGSVVYLTSTGSKWLLMSNPVGPQGATGPQGPSGAVPAFFPDMAALAATPAAGMAALGNVGLSGYYAGSTAGGGTFTWLTAAQATGLVPDGGTIIPPSDHPADCSEGCMKKVLPGNAIGFFDFGGKINDSGFDNKSAMEAASASAVANGYALRPECGHFYTSRWFVVPTGSSSLQLAPQTRGCGNGSNGTEIIALASASGTFVSMTEVPNTEFSHMWINCDAAASVTTCLDTKETVFTGPSLQNDYTGLKVEDNNSGSLGWNIENNNDSKFYNNACVGVAGTDCIAGYNATGDLEFFNTFVCPGMVEVDVQSLTMDGANAICGFDFDNHNFNMLNIVGGQIGQDASTLNVFNMRSGSITYGINLTGSYVTLTNPSSYVIGGAGQILGASITGSYLNNSSGGTVTLVQDTITSPNGTGAVVNMPNGINAGVTMGTDASAIYVMEGVVLNSSGLYDTPPHTVTPDDTDGFLNYTFTGACTTNPTVKNGLITAC